MFRFAEALSQQSASDQFCKWSVATKASATVQVNQFLNHNLQTFTNWKETTWQLVELLNLNTCHNQKFIQVDLDATMTIWTDSETYVVFLQYLLVVMAANCENSESVKLLVNER